MSITTHETRRDRAYRLAGAARVDWRTARSWLDGEGVRGVAGERLAIAARELGIERETRPTDPPPRAA